MQRLLALVVLFSISVSQAATPSPKAPQPQGPGARAVQPPQAPQAPPSKYDNLRTDSPYELKGVSVGAVFGYVDYKEPGLMRQYGKLYGVDVGYAMLNEASSIASNFEGQLVAGTITYDGGNLAGARYTQPTNDYIFNMRGTIGAYLATGSMFSITPYIGLGYRDLNDKIQGSGSYNRNISYLYLPIGAQFAGFFSDTWSYSFGADIDLVLLGTVVSKLSDVDSSAPDITNHNQGAGARLTASIRKNFSRFAVHVTPFYQKWKMRESDHVDVVIVTNQGPQPGYVAEPVNESDFIGLDVGMDF